MQRFIRLFLILIACAATPSAAQAQQTIETILIEETAEYPGGGADRFVNPAHEAIREARAAYGPFLVISEDRAALVAITDERSPGAFTAMLHDFPGIATLELVEAPGTHDDRANLDLGRMIRAHGIATHVPSYGSVRSGAVELFLAGARRHIDDGAEFAVHSWEDEDGMGPFDYSLEAPENAKYLSYYREMGMSDREAVSFYAMTNSMPFDSALWLDADTMRSWVRTEEASGPPSIAYQATTLDLEPVFN